MYRIKKNSQNAQNVERVFERLKTLFEGEHIGSEPLQDISLELDALSEDAYYLNGRFSVLAFVLSNTLSHIASQWCNGAIPTDYEIRIKREIKAPLLAVIAEIKTPTDKSKIWSTLADLLATNRRVLDTRFVSPNA